MQRFFSRFFRVALFSITFAISLTSLALETPAPETKVETKAETPKVDSSKLDTTKPDTTKSDTTKSDTKAVASTVGKLKPEAIQSKTTIEIVNQLSKHHYRQQELNDSLSSRFLDEYLKTL